ARGQRVLDACAAPGGKTAHILETEPALQDLVAVELASDRLQRVRDNLHRLRLQARLVQGDVGRPQDWWDGAPFDRILLDAPCSATGVIRRHPDIKLHRRPADVDRLTRLQAGLLDAVWPLLRPGGRLLYVTCSVLRAENALQIDAFVQRCVTARPVPIVADWGRPDGAGRQLLPSVNGVDAAPMDGFYYACLEKAMDEAA
ncbi:MAG TPA: 16S rRNA (cytosine(967)-C(5))-methyltransferase RsmB, partial [Thiohalobacter sp.]|nr:16S rRNA (cytosine(967)-C(5))-methyltransferase RsmB [Thiohalobacter sp.]